MAALRGSFKTTAVPRPGALCIVSDPPANRARSRMPARPNEAGLAAAVVRKPAPSSETVSLMNLSAAWSERFTVAAWECLAMLCRHS